MGDKETVSTGDPATESRAGASWTAAGVAGLEMIL